MFQNKSSTVGNTRVLSLFANKLYINQLHHFLLFIS